MVLTSTWWRFLENYVYAFPEPPPRKRTKPMQVICVGPPRSATESLQSALLQLGYDYTYHGWDIIFEDPLHIQGWGRLARRKYLNDAPGMPITTADFDALLGHSVAVTDAAASVFAAELIAAYPDAKVVLNTRKDLDKWLASMDESVLAINRNWLVWFVSLFDAKLWWVWNAWERLLWPGLFRCIDSREGFPEAVLARGKWVYEEHCNMIRGLVPPERLLEWSATDGWEPLCKFLGKEVPDTSFPHVNTKDKGFQDKLNMYFATLMKPAFVKAGLAATGMVGGLLGYGVYWYRSS